MCPTYYYEPTSSTTYIPLSESQPLCRREGGRHFRRRASSCFCTNHAPRRGHLGHLNGMTFIRMSEMFSFKIKRRFYKGQRRRRPPQSKTKKQINSAHATAFSSRVLTSQTEASRVIHPGLAVSSNFRGCGQFLTVASWPEAVYLTSTHQCVNSTSLNISGADRVSGSYQRQDTREDIRASLLYKVNESKDPNGAQKK